MRHSAEYDVAVLGAGPAGCAAAITAAKSGARVLLLEKGTYPRHKVCGEFVSPEAIGLLESLLSGDHAVSSLVHDAIRLHRARVFVEGHLIEAPVEPAAASLTRYTLDAALWKVAATSGVDCREQSPVDTIAGVGPFTIKTQHVGFNAKTLINASGRWSNLAMRHPPKGTKFIGLKAHFREAIADFCVDLYFFEGGYCGVQPISSEMVNVCAMVRADKATSLAHVFELHPELRKRSQGWKREFDDVTTSPLIFADPEPLRKNVLCVGDAAGFIDPFVGDGISMALHSGTMAAAVLQKAWTGKQPLARAAREYRKQYTEHLLPAFRAASRVRRFLSLPKAIRTPFLKAMRAKPLARMVVARTRVSVG